MKKILAFSLLISLSIGANASTDTTGSSMLVNQVMAMMGSSMVVANQILEHNGEKAKYSPQQISCMINTGNDVATQRMQMFLEKNFSKAELGQINAFYSSAAGKKHAEMNKNLMASLTSEDIDIAEVKPTPDEEKQINAFWQSKTGAKLGALLKNKAKLRPAMKIVIDKKQVDCNLPKSIM